MRYHRRSEEEIRNSSLFVSQSILYVGNQMTFNYRFSICTNTMQRRPSMMMIINTVIMIFPYPTRNTNPSGTNIKRIVYGCCLKWEMSLYVEAILYLVTRLRTWIQWYLSHSKWKLKPTNFHESLLAEMTHREALNSNTISIGRSYFMNELWKTRRLWSERLF